MTQYYLYMTSNMTKEELIEALESLNLECEYAEYFTQNKDELSWKLASINKRKVYLETLLKNK